MWLLILSFTQNIVRACFMFYPYEGYRTFYKMLQQVTAEGSINFIKNWKTSAVSTTNGWLTLNFASCVIRQTRSLGVLCILFQLKYGVWSISTIDMVVDTQFHKFYGSPFACVLYLFLIYERYRSVTPLGVPRVNRTILRGRCCP